MDLGILLLYVISCIGMTHIIVDSSILAGFRIWAKEKLPHKLYRVLECYQCCGLWCGMIMGAMLISWSNPFIIFACGCAGSFLSSVAATYHNYLEARTIISLGDDENE